jgi:hypothetical protein
MKKLALKWIEDIHLWCTKGSKEHDTWEVAA